MRQSMGPSAIHRSIRTKGGKRLASQAAPAASPSWSSRSRVKDSEPVERVPSPMPVTSQCSDAAAMARGFAGNGISTVSSPGSGPRKVTM